MRPGATASPDKRIFEFGGFRLDAAERSLSCPDASAIQLTPRLFDTLLFMLERQGRLVDKQSLLDSVWAGVVVEENTLSRTVSALRHALGERGGEHRFIATVPGVGYRFVHPVNVVEPETEAAAPSSPRSIAVLPFDDLSPARDQQYFADGIAEEVLNRLTQIPDLRAIARTSSFLLRNAQDDPRAIGTRLGVDHLLTGSVRKDGARLRINVHLVEAATSRQLWSRQFDRELADVFAVQEDIARAVTRALGATFATDVRSFGRASNTNLETYDLFLRGISVYRGGGDAFQQALVLMRRALELDPEFAPAWLWVVAMNRALLIFVPERANESRRALREAAGKAAELVPDSWAAHLARSVVCQTEYDWEGMERCFVRAAERVPALPPELGFNYGVFRAQVGDTALAIEHLERAVRDDPLSLIASSVYQTLLHCGGREAEAEAEYRRTLALPGDHEVAEHAALHRAWARGDDMRAPLHRHLETQKRLTPVLTELYAVCDAPRAALAVLGPAADDPAHRDPMRQVALAWWLAHYGDTDGALACLGRAYVEQRFLNLAFLWYPVFAGVRRDPRFKDILREVGLVDYWRARGQWGDHCRPVGADDFECA
jgi:TolB-like protein